MDPCTSSWSPQEQYRSERLALEIRTLVEDVISYAFSEKQRSFFAFERGLSKRIASLGCLFVALFLQVRHERLDVNSWSKRLGSRAHGKSARRTLRTMFGEVAYWRHYFYGKKRGCHPLDIELGLFADGFSPMVIGLMTRMATRMSFKTSGAIFGAFLRWSPSTRTIEEMVLGLGRKAAPFMEETPSKQVGDDEILVIEADGKATPTATEQELEKRRGKRSKPCENGCLCGCQRHRSRRKRAKRDTPARRKKGDKSKNGKSATIVANIKGLASYRKRRCLENLPRKAGETAGDWRAVGKGDLRADRGGRDWRRGALLAAFARVAARRISSGSVALMQAALDRCVLRATTAHCTR